MTSEELVQGGALAVSFVAALGLMAGLWLLWRRSVWAQLVRRYPHPGFSSRRAFWFRSGRVGGAQMQLTLLIGADERGLSLALGLPFLHGQAMLVPWEAVEGTEERRIWGQPQIRLTFPEVDGAQIEIYGRWTEAFERASEGRYRSSL